MRGDELVLEDQILPREGAEGRVHPDDYGVEASLAPGRYRAEVWFEDGLRASGEFTIEAGRARPAAARAALTSYESDRRRESIP